MPTPDVTTDEPPTHTLGPGGATVGPGGMSEREASPELKVMTVDEWLVKSNLERFAAGFKAAGRSAYGG